TPPCSPMRRTTACWSRCCAGTVCCGATRGCGWRAWTTACGSTDLPPGWTTGCSTPSSRRPHRAVAAWGSGTCSLLMARCWRPSGRRAWSASRRAEGQLRAWRRLLQRPTERSRASSVGPPRPRSPCVHSNRRCHVRRTVATGQRVATQRGGRRLRFGCTAIPGLEVVRLPHQVGHQLVGRGVRVVAHPHAPRVRADLRERTELLDRLGDAERCLPRREPLPTAPGQREPRQHGLLDLRRVTADLGAVPLQHVILAADLLRPHVEDVAGIGV